VMTLCFKDDGICPEPTFLLVSFIVAEFFCSPAKE